MRDEDDFKAPDPVYPSTLHSDVVGECRKAWGGGRPWTNIRVLQKGADNLEGASCCERECTKPVEAVQYSSRFGDPLFYCADHAVAQQERDVAHYDLGPNGEAFRPKFTEEDEVWIKKLLSKGKKKEKIPEEEFEP